MGWRPARVTGRRRLSANSSIQRGEVNHLNRLYFRYRPADGFFHTCFEGHSRHCAHAAVAHEFQPNCHVFGDFQHPHVTAISLEVRSDIVERRFYALGDVFFLHDTGGLRQALISTFRDGTKLAFRMAIWRAAASAIAPNASATGPPFN